MGLRLPCKQDDKGSTPFGSTNAISSAAEHLAYIQGVVGSNPASRTRG